MTPAALPAAVADGTAATPPSASARRLPWRTAMVGALVVTLVRPATWVVGLAGFLAGGGILVLAWPILVLPTPTGLQNLLGAPVSTLVFGSPSGELITLVVVSGGAAITLLVGGLLIGSWAERRAIALVLGGAEDEGLVATGQDVTGGPGTVRVTLLRSLALVPPLVVFALAWPTLYAVTYHELILPDDLATPLVLRVASQIPLLIAALIGSWLLADAAGAVAVRRLVIERRGILRAWALGWMDLARRPLRVIGAAVVGLAALVVAAGPALVAAALAWFRVREALLLAPDSGIGIVVVALSVAIWLGALVLAGAGAALRSAAWTMEGVAGRADR